MRLDRNVTDAVSDLWEEVSVSVCEGVRCGDDVVFIDDG